MARDGIRILEVVAANTSCWQYGQEHGRRGAARSFHASAPSETPLIGPFPSPQPPCFGPSIEGFYNTR